MSSEYHINEMNAAVIPRLHVVILAAGFSSRLGRPKALVRVRSRSLLHRTLNLVAGLDPAKIALVLPPRAARLRIEAQGFKAIFAVNSARAAGLSTSVRRGITVSRCSAGVLILPVDLAVLDQRDITRLISRWRAARRRLVARRIAGGPGAPHGGTPLILPRRLYGRALEVAGDAGLRDLVRALPVQQRALLDLPSASFDVDTPADLHRARRRHRTRLKL
jgi:molybdenum cofactor cytidylyltransferase